MKLHTASVGLLLSVMLSGCVSLSEQEWARTKEFGWPVEASPQSQAYAHFIASAIYERQGNKAKAIEEMQEAARLDPDALTPTLRLIKIYLRNQEYLKALEMCKRAVEQKPDRANLWVVLGEIHQRLKQFDDAKAAYKKAIELNPGNILGYGALVDLQESTNDLVSAIDLYHELIKLSPESAGLYYQLGLNLARIKDTEGARAALNRAVELNQNLIQAYYMLGILNLEAGNNEEAVARLEYFIKLRPSDPSGLEMLAGVLARLGRYDDAFNHFATLLAADQVKPQFNIEMMCLLMLAGKPGEAEKYVPASGAPYFGTLFTALARKHKGEPYLPLLESLDTIEGDLDKECNECLNGLLYLYGKQATGEWLLSSILPLRGEVKSHTLGVIHARILMSMERHDEAVKVLEILLNGTKQDMWLHYYLAMSCEALKNFEKTESNLIAYLVYNPDDPDTLNFLGYLYAENGVKLDKAEELLQKALRITPESPFYMDSLGWVYYKQGKAQEAIDLIQKAIYRMDTDDAILRDHLGDAFLLNGDIERAIGEWERARRLDPKLEGVQEKIDKHKDKASPKK